MSDEQVEKRLKVEDDLNEQRIDEEDIVENQEELDKTGRGRLGRTTGRGFFKKKVCRFCTQKLKANYKTPEILRRFTTERGKILPRRITGTCAKHQRVLSLEIKRARCLALLPFVEK